MSKVLIAFTDAQEAWLKKEAKLRGVSTTEYVRQMVAGRMPEKTVKLRKLHGVIYETFMRGKWIYDGSKSLPDMVKRLEAQRDHLLAMQEDGVVVSDEVHDDYVHLATDNKKVAEKYGMMVEQEG